MLAAAKRQSEVDQGVAAVGDGAYVREQRVDRLEEAGAARGRRNGFRGGGARVERAVETSRRERLESKLAATRAEARRGGARGW